MNKIITILSICFFIVGCSPATPEFTPTIANTDTPIPTSTLEPTAKVTATISPSSTPTPYSIEFLGFPLNIEDVVTFRKNFNCPTTYGDNSHDGIDISVVSNKDVPVLATDDGYIEFVHFINDSIGYEVRIVIGKDASTLPIAAHYVHLSSVKVQEEQDVTGGDVIGYISEPLGGNNHLHFEVRIGNTPRMETSSDGAKGDEIDITEILSKYVPTEKIGYDDRYNSECK